VDGLRFEVLPQLLKNQFDRFDVSVAEISDATTDEVTNLFSRLQLGVPLNPAELRNAIQGPMRHVIDNIARSHDFFISSRISDTRYKRQDFLTHAFAVAAYGGYQGRQGADAQANDCRV
jgi:hypothetical protein